MYHSGIPPLVAGATTLPGGKHVTGFAGRLQLPYESSSFATPANGGTITRAYCRAIYEESVSRCFILPPEQGWQGNTIRKEAKRPENRVTRFPVEKSGAAG